MPRENIIWKERTRQIRRGMNIRVVIIPRIRKKDASSPVSGLRPPKPGKNPKYSVAMYIPHTTRGAITARHAV
jgi:hypothetical protein